MRVSREPDTFLRLTPECRGRGRHVTFRNQGVRSLIESEVWGKRVGSGRYCLSKISRARNVRNEKRFSHSPFAGNLFFFFVFHSLDARKRKWEKSHKVYEFCFSKITFTFKQHLQILLIWKVQIYINLDLG